MSDDRPWVEWPRTRTLPDGARVREEWVNDGISDEVRYIHPDDVPADPDADLVEAIAFTLYQQAGGADFPHMSSASDRDHFILKARIAVAAIREQECNR